MGPMMNKLEGANAHADADADANDWVTTYALLASYYFYITQESEFYTFFHILNCVCFCEVGVMVFET